MRRTAIALTLLALVAGFYACSADAPTAPRPPNGGGGSSAITIQLFTSDANPKAGTCTLVQAVVSFNGNPVPDGTAVAFSTRRLAAFTARSAVVRAASATSISRTSAGRFAILAALLSKRESFVSPFL